MKSILFSNQKGGVGKTTLTRNIGWYLSGLGHSVLLLDSDPQGNLSKSLFLEEEIREGLPEALENGTIRTMKVKENLELLSGDKRLAALEKKLVGEIDGYTRLRELLKREELTRYDFILIDSPPSLGMLTANALSASSYLVIPLSASVFSLQGTNDLFETMKKVKSTFNPDIKLLGVIVNAFDEVPVISREIREEIKSSFGDYAFSCLLSKSIKIEEAAASRIGVTALSGRGTEKVKREIADITDELFLRLGS